MKERLHVMRVVEWLFRSFAAMFLLVPTFAFAQGQGKAPARSVSPDGKWEFRSGAAGEQGDFVIAKAGSDETALVLSEEEYVDGLAERMGRAPDYANIVLGADSKRFAFNLQPGKGYQTTQFYQLDGNTWRKLDSLESNAATTAPIDPAMVRQEKKLKLGADWPFSKGGKFANGSIQALRFYMPVRLKLPKSETRRKR